MNLYVPSNTNRNTTYVCSIATPDGTTLTWEFRGRQINTDNLFEDAFRRGIYVEPWPIDNTMTATTLTVSEQARQTDKEHSVQCVASGQDLQNRSKRRPLVPYSIIFYGESSILVLLEIITP